ncbi:AidA/PixA family protein [Trinickia mobilis]|uniref:AidA/PixA family protein n=1 Tax=Trinickia mobilis TaxID=2816356 RepID=UPI001A909CFD|nr:AidA/PixA family protein [Trinickia mobilis]
MAANIGKHAQARRINVLVVIDTANVKCAYGPNENIEHPQPIAHEGQFLISPSSRAIVHGQGAGKLRLRAKAGDQVAIRVTSIGGNASDAVIAYRVHPSSRMQVFDHFEQVFLTREGAVRPDPDSPSRDGLPPVECQAHFSSFDTTVMAHGAERIEIAFALYALSSNGQRQDPFGYYVCNPAIDVV